jgi:soluble lytic murein transglycosylase-like protein
MMVRSLKDRIPMSLSVLSKTFAVATSLALFATSSVAVAKPKNRGVTHAKKVAAKSSIPKNQAELKQFIRGTTQKLLSKNDQGAAEEIADTIIDVSAQYKFDPIFLMAVIQNESSFNPNQKGGVGEVGLMQLKPSSAKWIAKQYKLHYEDEKTLLDPSDNIKIGVALLDRLRKQFTTKGHLFLAAYNMGEGNVRKFVKNKTYPREYARAVMTRYLALSRAFGSLANAKKKGAMAYTNLHNINRLPGQKVKI